MAARRKRFHTYSDIGLLNDNTSDESKKFCIGLNSSSESLLGLPISHCAYRADQTDEELSNESEIEEHAYSVQKRNGNLSNRRSTTQLLNGSRSMVFNGISKTKRRKCESKNAIVARINRLKKKKYIEDIEIKNAKLEEENKILKDLLNRKIEDVNSLKRETANLRSVIRNHTEIGSLIKCIKQNTNLQISSSLIKDSPTDLKNNPCVPQTAMRSTISNDDDEQSRPTVQEEGNDVLNEFTFSPNSQIPLITDIFCDNRFDFSLNTPLSSKSSQEFENVDALEPEVQQTELTIGQNPELTNSDVYLRCETPSSGYYDDLYSKENGFDDMGICFHIANKKVSLEFCDTCNFNASL